MENRKKKIKFGDVWIAIKDYKITEWFSPQKNCIIPKGTRIVILNKPPKEATAFHFMCITTKRLNKKLLPDLKQMEMRKEGFGITIFIETFFNYFKLDKNQKIEFTQSAA